jgi:hypothetical protein
VVDGVTSNNNTKDAGGEAGDGSNRDEDPEGEEEEEIEEIDEAALQYLEEEGEEEEDEEGDIVLRPEAVMKLHLEILEGKQLGGVGHTRLRVRGSGSPNSDDWRKA